jgi:hypothetical protein
MKISTGLAYQELCTFECLYELLAKFLQHLQKVDQQIVAMQQAYDRAALIIQRMDRDLQRMESLTQVQRTTTRDTPLLLMCRYNVMMFSVCSARLTLSSCLLFHDSLDHTRVEHRHEWQAIRTANIQARKRHETS